MTVSYLLFDDGTILFNDAISKQPGYIRAVLLCFEAISRLRVNVSKNELVPVGEVGGGEVEQLARVLGCKVGSFPMTYLGLPFGSSFKAHD